MRSTGKTVAWILVCAPCTGLLLGLLVLRRPARGRGCNVLLITLDTTRADRLGCYGFDKAATPALDGLAARGTLFEHAFTCAPLTLPAHVTMFTGLYPPEHGLRLNDGRDALGKSVPLVHEILAESGYRTGAFIAAAVLESPYGLSRGFEHYDDTGLYPTTTVARRQMILTDNPEHMPYKAGDRVVDSALEWLQRVAPDRSPFFCWVHLFDPHLPGHWHREIFGNRFNHQYDAEIAFMDRQIARLMSFIRTNGLERETLVIAVGDHGEGLGESGESSHGFFLYSTLHVPLIVSMPGTVNEGERVSETVSLVDLAPSILDFLKIRETIGNSCRSFAPSWQGGAVSSRAHYAEALLPYYALGCAPLYACVTPEWKYIHTRRPELFQMPTDLRHTNDLAAANAAAVHSLRMQLDDLTDMMQRFQTIPMHLTAAQAKALESLGYLGSGAVIDRDLPDVSALKDIKDLAPIIDLFLSVRTRLVDGRADPDLLSDCSRLTKHSPGTAVFHGLHGIALSALGRPEEALLQLTAAIEAKDGSLSRNINMNVSIHNNMGSILADKGRLARAIKHFGHALQLRPDGHRIRANLSQAHAAFAHQLAMANDLDGALRHLREALELTPDNPRLHNNLGIVLMRRKSVNEAVAHFRTALKLNPAYEAARRNLAAAQRTLPLRPQTQPE